MMKQPALHTGATPVVTLLLLLAGATARAQDSASEQAKTAPYAMPELPAVAFIGGQANTIARPVTPRALATDIVNGVDANGHLKQGLAVAATPFSLLGGSVNLSQYQGAWWRAALYNAQLSAGSVRTATDNSSTDLGTGLRIVLYDNSDPMRNSEYTAHIRQILVDALPGDPSDAAVNAAFEKAKKDVIAYRKQWRKDNWSRSGLAVAAASGWQLNESKLLPNPDNRWLGWSTWATQSIRLTKSGQIMGQVRYTDQQRLVAADGSIQRSAQVDYGGRAIVGSAIVNFSAELTGVSRSNPLSGAPKSGVEWAAGVEFRISDAIWLSTSLGKKLSNDANTAPGIVFAGLRWEVNTDARIQVPPK
jgi:hypothetical protein